MRQEEKNRGRREFNGEHLSMIRVHLWVLRVRRRRALNTSGVERANGYQEAPTWSQLSSAYYSLTMDRLKYLCRRFARRNWRKRRRSFRQILKAMSKDWGIVSILLLA